MMRCLSLLLCCLAVLSGVAKGYQTFEENGKIGMKDDVGNVVLPPAFEALGWSDGNFSVIGEVTGYRLNGLWGVISLKKEFITKADYESLFYNGGDCIVARKKINAVFSKSGCINLKGEIKIPFVYDGIQIQGLRAIVFNLSRARYSYGLTDLTNQILIPIAYRNIRPLGTLRFAVENQERKIALFNDLGAPVTSFSIDSISDFYKSFARIYQNQWQGLIDRNGVIKLEAKYNSIKIDQEGNVYAKLPNEWLFINNKNETVRQFFAEELKPLNENTFIVRKGKLFGLTDRELKTTIPTEYESLTEIAPEKYLVAKDNKLGVIDQNNNIVVPFSYDSLANDHNMYRAFIRNLGWQLLTAGGKLIAKYDQLKPSNSIGFPAFKKGFSGIVDFEGHEFVHCVFDSISKPVEGLLSVKFKSKYGIINSNEDWLVPPQPFPLTVINATRYVQHQPGNHFVKSFAGEIIYFTPNPLSFSTENFTEILPDGTERKITYNGEVIPRTEISIDVTHIFPESEGLRGIKKDEHYGFVDGQGRLRIANRYDSIGEFHEGLAAVKLIGRWGFVNSSDQIAINPNYDNSSFFKHGLAIVSRNKKFGLIDKNGTAVLPLRYDYVRVLPDATYLIGVEHLQGLADKSGNILVEAKYDSLVSKKNKLLLVARDGKFGSITDHGNNVIPMIYDQLEYIDAASVFLGEKKSEWKLVEIK